jgi:hypothetical protein
MLQEEQTVAFDPMEVHVPWYTALFRLYLGLVVVLAIFRLARFLWTLRKQRTVPGTESTADDSSLSEFWERSFIRARSFKTLSHLTFLIAVTVLAWTLSGVSLQVATQRTSSIGAIAGALADALKTFSVGAAVSTALFCCGSFCESLIHRRRFGAGWPRSHE